MNESFARELLADVCAKLYERKLTVSAGGNMSIRINDIFEESTHFAKHTAQELDAWLSHVNETADVHLSRIALTDCDPWYYDRDSGRVRNRDGSFFQRMGEYMQAGEQRGFNPLAPATDAFEEYALSVFSAQLGVFATHDVYVAAFLHARGVKTDFNPDNWPRFLDSAAIVLRPDGERRYIFVRAGLSPLACGVA